MRLKYKVLASTALAATLLTGTALAANLSVTAPTTYSREGVAGLAATAPVTLPTTNIVLQAQYAEQDLITVTVVGPTLHSSTLPVMACTTPAGLVVGFLGRTGNVITFRVTQVQSGTSTVGGTCTLTGLTTLGTDLANVSTVTVNYSAQTGVGGLALDTACTGANCVANTATIATVRDQFNAAANAGFNAVVDVNKLRYEFVAPDTNDTFSFQQWSDVNVNLSTPANPAEAPVFAAPTATPVSGAVVLSGNFSWLDANDDGTCSNAEYQAAVTTSQGTVTGGSPTGSCSAVAINQGTVENLAIVITLTPLAATQKNVLAAQKFSAVVTLTYNNGGASNVSKSFTLSAGEWILNGFSAFVGYMPYGTGISQIIYAANSSSQTGDITIDGYNEAGVSCAFNAGTMPAGSTKQLSGAIKTGFETCYGAGFTGKVAFDVVINIPSSSGDLYSAYNVNSVDRGTVVNTANGK